MRNVNGQQVVVINDDPIQLRLLCHLLKKDGMQVLACQSAEEGLALMLAHGVPDAVVTDLHMPGIDGWRLCRLLRSPEYAAFNQVPILVVSATFAGEHAYEITRDLAANDFLPMPCDSSTFRAHVRALLGGLPPQRSLKVLIIEDSPTLAGLLKRTFEEHGYTPAVALTGEEGRRLFQDQAPETVVLDYHLPDMTGDKLLQEFKQPGGLAVVIIITTNSDPDLATRFFRLGANDYLRKPFDPHYLIERCKKAHREQALLRVEEILEARTQQLRDTLEKLQVSEEKYRALMDRASDGIALVDLEGKILEINEKMVAITGYLPADLVGRKYWVLHADQEREQAQACFVEIQQKGEGALYHSLVQRRDGHTLPVDISGSLVTCGEHKVVQLIFRNLSERLKIEEKRLKMAKLESLGLLAGGIAHDFNNLLTVILGNISLAELEPGLSTALRECLHDSSQACLRAQAQAQCLLTFARGGVPVKKTTALPKLLTEAADFALSGSPCRGVFSFPPDLWPVDLDAGQFSQALHNLLVNAVQAMPQGGIIRVSVENLTLPEESGAPFPPGKYLKVAIADSGVGIDPAHLNKIFDPYFSTKPLGSGLGLATTYSIIKNHGGHIQVESTPGEGTTFTLWLSASRQEMAPPPAEAREAHTGKGKILVMDDEDMVRRVVGKILTHLGYEAELAREGGEALSLYTQAKESGRPFDVVILDLTVPGGLGGKETMARLRQLNPQVKGIVISGYSDDLILTNFRDYGFSNFIKKPFKIKEFSEVLFEVLTLKVTGKDQGNS